MKFACPAPARWPALLFLLPLMLLPGACSLLPGAPPAQPEAASTPAPAFALQIDTSDATVRQLLLQHLELQRFRQLPDLRAAELQRLTDGIPGNARELLGTLGYFNPAIAVDVSAGTPPTITVTVERGPQTQVVATQITLTSPGSDAAARERREAQLQRNFALQAGSPFTQSAWDDAKAQGLRQLQQRRFPTARIAASRADIDAAANTARLSVVYASGPLYRFGPLAIDGGERYDSTGTARIARLPEGEVYAESALLDAQQRLSASGYYDSVFLTLDTESTDAQAAEATAPVTAHVRDAKLQKAVFGIGFSTDNGARLSLDHTHNRLPWLGWRALSQVQLSKSLKSLSTKWMGLPHEDGWRWIGGAQLRREDTGSFKTDSTQWRFGRSKSSEAIDRSHWLQYDMSRAQGAGAPPMAAALTANWGRTWRYFNNPTAPTRGWGLAAELGAGSTLRTQHDPFLRALLRWQGFVALGRVRMNEQVSRASRLSLRLEGGAVLARKQAAIPSTQLFLTGGDATVRGYSWQSIGAHLQGNQIYGGRYLTVASIEWQRPIALRGNVTDFESATFIDIGAVGDTPDEMRPRVGLGAGLRWRSPVGPLQADVAWGVQARQLRLHLRLGFSF
ncbi:autotransporter assembly complex protein TamA [Comamonas badia]|uniref:autotransporter assembly complex protein TamA n=1 Tax=Comamonas badia TaxID=265291 RepID=UPI000465FAF9